MVPVTSMKIFEMVTTDLKLKGLGPVDYTWLKSEKGKLLNYVIPCGLHLTEK